MHSKDREIWSPNQPPELEKIESESERGKKGALKGQRNMVTQPAAIVGKKVFLLPTSVIGEGVFPY